jgi:hypothetical protein
MTIRDPLTGHSMHAFSGDFQESLDSLRAAMAADTKRAAAADGYLPSQCPLGLHDNLYPGPDGECEDCELQGLA